MKRGHMVSDKICKLFEENANFDKKSLSSKEAELFDNLTKEVVDISDFDDWNVTIFLIY